MLLNAASHQQKTDALFNTCVTGVMVALLIGWYDRRRYPVLHRQVMQITRQIAGITRFLG